MKRSVLLSLILLIILTGCWDSRLLRDITIVKSAGIDLLEDGTFQSTVASPIPDVHEADERTQIITGTGNTILDARMSIDNQTAERVDIAKLHVLILGEELVRKRIYPALDIIFRDPRSSLGSKVAVFDGKAGELISRRLEDKPRKSDFLADLLETAENSSIVETLNVQLICPILFDPGEDIVLPYLSMGEDDQPYLKGTALFNGETMAGTLDTSDSTMLMLMKGEMGPNVLLTEQVYDNQDMDVQNYVTIKVKESVPTLDLEVKSSSKSVNAKFNHVLKVEVIEFPHDQMQSEEVIVDLNEKLSKQLTNKAETIFSKLQETNCDALGIGRKLFGFHHPYWEEVNWQDEYPNITFTSDVNVEIIHHGIIN
ncbi:Ger(x)C family spore germination protein [Alteribacter populi]|uniref:Ger(x)C family spore germination protein n=1 Tax=Alteribacter populi TaxID=2011011 RepID=UPI000BBAA7EB|nr:Ger(x)C family spore germination protein [Alteribacter populi]